MAQLLGHDKQGCRVGVWYGKPHELHAQAIAAHLVSWAIYRDYTVHGAFHNATNELCLLWHYNDSYWLNRGVSSIPQ